MAMVSEPGEHHRLQGSELQELQSESTNCRLESAENQEQRRARCEFRIFGEARMVLLSGLVRLGGRFKDYIRNAGRGTRKKSILLA